MQTPYQILGLTPDASDSEIKHAYLQQVKQYPPEDNQQQFQQIHHAYSAIKDHHSRVSYDLFTLPTRHFDHLIDAALHTANPSTLDSNTLKYILSNNVTDIDQLNAIVNKR